MIRPGIEKEIVAAIEREAHPLMNHEDDLDPVINAARNRRYVLLGEASHGTKEFYALRAEITRRLIEEAGFDAVAAEADWPDAYSINRYVCLMSGDIPAAEALADFERFPAWMWRNTEVLHFIEWLRGYNSAFRRPQGESGARWPAGFYGLDMYSMGTSIRAVLAYLDKMDAQAAKRARGRYACLDHFMDNPQLYGYAMEQGAAEACEKQVVTQLVDLQLARHDYMMRDGFVAEDDFFSAVQNARLVHSAERYYRAMYRGRPNSWNLRDEHMFHTLKELSAHLSARLGRPARIAVWAHNSHVGNAAATEMGRRGELNIGQLARAGFGDQALLVGFSTARGTVMAASNWDEPAQAVAVNPPFPGSYEDIFHRISHKRFVLDLRSGGRAADLLAQPRLQRAIGVVYRPLTERQSHYFFTKLPEQFDFMIHIDETSAVQPLAVAPHPRRGEMDETYPYGV